MVILVVDGALDDSAAHERFRRSVELARAGSTSQLVIASNGSIPAIDGVGLISFSERYPLGNAISEFLRTQPPAATASSHVTIVGTQMSSVNDASAVIQKLLTARAPISFISTRRGSESVEFLGMGDSGIMPAHIFRDIQKDAEVPAAGISVARSLFRDTQFACTSLAGLALELVLEAYSRGEEVREIEGEICMPSSSTEMQVPQLDLAKILRRAIELIPVEELFPDNSWDARRSESTTACYHRIAAKFITLGDLESADSCLNQADRIGESPRALALRAVVAMERGETLGAIAKLITSLQEYEQQKRSSSLSVEENETKNFDSVNNELKQGLSALNSQDNGSALRHFARAVREFDSFYRESGLLLLV